MAFTKKSKPAKPSTDVTNKPQFSEAQSNQEKFTDTGARAIGLRESHAPGMTYMSTARETGNQAMLGPNTKNTGTVKDALNAYKQNRMLAVENPDGQSSRISNNRRYK